MERTNVTSPVRTRVLGAVLLAVHAVLVLWGAAGLAELAGPVPSWAAVANPELPGGVLVVHWLAMLGAGSVFVIGYLVRWPATPAAMVVAYAVLATVCAVETFGYLTGEFRFLNMAAEYTAYGVLIVLLHKGPLKATFANALRRPAGRRGRWFRI
jgi:hypothetical protein